MSKKKWRLITSYEYCRKCGAITLHTWRRKHKFGTFGYYCNNCDSKSG